MGSGDGPMSGGRDDRPGRFFPLLQRLIRLLRHPDRIPRAIRIHFFGEPAMIDWDIRARERGAASVLDDHYSSDEYHAVTAREKESLYPLLRQQLTGRERTVLDFGCGPGRFTGDLADITGGHVIGMDITARLLALAPPHPNVEYVHCGALRAEWTSFFDVIWINSVLGGLPDAEVTTLARNLTGVLADGGLLFVIESTALFPSGEVWRIRTREQITSLFPSVPLRHVGSRHDPGDELSIMAGRK